MARLEITVSNPKTGQITAREVFDLDDQTAHQLLDRLEKMVASFERPVQVVKTVAPNGVITLDLRAGCHRPSLAVPQPTFEDRFRRRALPTPGKE